MIELLFAAGQWLGVFVFVFCACLVIKSAADEIRNVPVNLAGLTTHDWDAPDRATQNARRLDSW